MRRYYRGWVIVLLIAFAGGCQPAPSQPAGRADTGASKPENRPTIAFVTNQIANFWNIAEVGCLDAAKDFDVEVDVRFPDEATATWQKQIVEDLLASGIDALAISPIDAENQVQSLNSWAGQIPLITHDSDAPGTDRLMYIGMDNYRAGRMVGELIKEALPKGGQVVLTVGRMEQDNAQKRRQGVIDELLGRNRDDSRRDPVEGEIQGDKYTILATLTDQGKPEVAKQKAEDALNTWPEADCFVGLFAYNPPAIIQAVKQANRLGQVVIVGFDEDDATLQGIKDGHVVGTVVQNPYEYGYQSVRVLTEILKGNRQVIPESRFADIPPRKVTLENVDAFWADLKAKIGATTR